MPLPKTVSAEFVRELWNAGFIYLKLDTYSVAVKGSACLCVLVLMLPVAVISQQTTIALGSDKATKNDSDVAHNFEKDTKGTINSPQSNFLQPIWFRTWGDKYDDIANSIAVDDSNIYTVGYAFNRSSTSYDVFVLKYDLNGNLTWDLTWGDNNDNEATSVAVENSNVYVTGNTDNSGISANDVFILKIDQDGNLVWNVTWGGSKVDYGQSIATDGLYLYVTGYTCSYGAGSDDIFILKYDLNGTLLWNITWGGINEEYGWSIAVDESNIYIAGESNSYGLNGTQALVLKYNLAGKLVWYRVWGYNGSDRAFSITVQNKTIYITGDTTSFGGGGWIAFLVKYDMNGVFLWYRIWGDGNRITHSRSIALCSPYIYISTGTHVPSNNSTSVRKYDLDGKFIWEKGLEGHYLSLAPHLALDKSSIYIAGEINNVTLNEVDVFVLRCDLNGSNSGNYQPTSSIDVISPNPAYQGQNITFVGHGVDIDGTIISYDWRSSIDGQLSKQASFVFDSLSVGTHRIYFKVQDNNNTWSSQSVIILTVVPLSAIPFVVITFPTDGAMDVSTSTRIVIGFSKPMNKNATESSISITPGSISNMKWDVSCMNVTLNISLIEKTRYVIKISTMAKDIMGYSLLNNYSFSFTTKSPSQNDYFIILAYSSILITILIVIIVFLLKTKKKRKNSTTH